MRSGHHDNLSAFDRVMNLWEAAAETSKRDEDAYLESNASPRFTDETRKRRRALVLSGVITFAICFLELRPEELSPLKLDLKGVQNSWIVWGTGLFTLYFWVEFIVHGASDFRAWRTRGKVAYKRLQDSLARERGQSEQTFRNEVDSNLLETYRADLKQRFDRYGVDLGSAGDSRFAPLIGIWGVGWLEFKLAHLLAIVAVLSWIRALWCSALPGS